MSNGNSAAYPEQLVEDRHGDLQPASAFYDVGGLTKREKFAAMAMQGMLSRDASRPDDASKEAAERFRRNVAREATRHADALLAALQANCGEA